MKRSLWGGMGGSNVHHPWSTGSAIAMEETLANDALPVLRANNAFRGVATKDVRHHARCLKTQP